MLARRGKEAKAMAFGKATYDTLKVSGEAMKISEWFPLDGKVDASKAASDVRTGFSVSKETAKAVLVSWKMKDGTTVESWVPKAAFEEAPWEARLRRRAAEKIASGKSAAEVAETLRRDAESLKADEIKWWERNLEGLAGKKGKYDDSYYDIHGAFHERTRSWDWERRLCKEKLAEFKEIVAACEKIAGELETEGK